MEQVMIYPLMYNIPNIAVVTQYSCTLYIFVHCLNSTICKRGVRSCACRKLKSNDYCYSCFTVDRRFFQPI